MPSIRQWFGVVARIPFSRRVAGALIVLVPLAVLLSMAVLWSTGHREAYTRALTNLGVVGVYRYPFVDTQSVLCWVDHHRIGVDAYRAYPCNDGPMTASWDPANVQVADKGYAPPLWFYIVPPALGAKDTEVVGMVLCLGFLGSLALLLRPASFGEAAVFLAGAASPTVLYALERGSNDMLMFILAVVAGALFGRRGALRALAYALSLVSGLLKIYPVTVLLLVVRERLGIAAAAVLVLTSLLAGFTAIFQADILAMLSRTTIGGFSDPIFAATNLAQGLGVQFPGFADLLGGKAPAAVTTILCLAALVGAVAIARRLTQQGARLDWETPWATYLIIGAGLSISCFFALHNGYYRAIDLLFVLPGLMRLGGAVRDRRLRLLFRTTVGVVLYLLWTLWPYSMALVWNAPSLLRANMFLRDVAWWWAVSVLGGVVLAFVAQSRAVADLRAGLGRAAKPAASAPRP